jgi:hypothetical protein
MWQCEQALPAQHAAVVLAAFGDGLTLDVAAHALRKSLIRFYAV